MADKDYYSFEEVLKNLKLEEDELKRLVSAGEIRAFRDKNTMRFKAEDVDRLRPDAGGDLELDDLELELEDDVKPAPAAVRTPAPASSREIREIKTVTFDDAGTTEEIELESSAPAATVEEVDLGGDMETESDVVRPARAARGGTPSAARRTTTRTTVEDDVEQTEGVGTLAMLIVGAAILLCSSFVVLDAVFGHSSNPLSKAVSGMFK